MALRGLVWIALAAACSASLFGLLAPIWPIAEFGNHFRPYILVGCLVLAVTAGILGQSTGALAALGAALVGATLMGGIVVLAPSAPAAETSGRPIKILDFNVWVGNRRAEDVVALLREEAADIVFLQELDGRLARAILPGVADLYPHVLSCDAAPNCRLALLSRSPWLEAEHQQADNTRPRLVRARFGDDLGGLQIVGTHLATPLHAELQARNAAWITDYAAALQSPAIVLGDFNLTPWSWRLFNFARVTGLRRLGTWGHSWPAPGTVKGLPVALFRIDHIFVSGGIAAHRWRVGPPAGSDHLPVVVTLSLEEGAALRP